MTSHALALALTLASPTSSSADTFALGARDSAIGFHVASSADSARTQGSLAVPFAIAGAVVGAIAFVQLGDPKGAGDYAGLARVSLIGTGVAIGAAAGAFIGSRIHVRRKLPLSRLTCPGPGQE